MILLLILINSTCQAQVTLRFQPQIDIKATQLGDLLRIQNDTHDWSALPLQSHPTAGEIITKEKIIAWMRQRLGDFSYQWQGKSLIKVSQLSQSSADALLEKAKTALVAQLGSKYSRTELKALSRPKDSPFSIDSFQADANTSYPTAKRVCVWLRHDKERIAVWFHVKAYAQVLVANRDLPFHTLIKDNEFSWKERDIAGLNDKPAQSIPTHVWLKSPIAHGNILLADLLRELPLVIEGQAVKVDVHRHRIDVVMDAVALNDGYLGQRITIKNPLNQKTFVAIVSGFQQAEILS
jgi:flagella basal body P-ring formation protein FlgA